jgi:hypothetical protein
MDQKRLLQSVLLRSVLSRHKGLCLPKAQVPSIFQITLFMHFYLLQACKISGPLYTPLVQKQ